MTDKQYAFCIKAANYFFIKDNTKLFTKYYNLVKAEQSTHK